MIRPVLMIYGLCLATTPFVGVRAEAAGLDSAAASPLASSAFSAGLTRGQALTRCLDAAMPGRAHAGEPGAPPVTYTSDTEASIRSCMRANGYGDGGETVATVPSAGLRSDPGAASGTPPLPALPDQLQKPVEAASSGIVPSSSGINAPPVAANTAASVFVPSDKAGPAPVYLH